MHANPEIQPKSFMAASTISSMISRDQFLHLSSILFNIDIQIISSYLAYSANSGSDTHPHFNTSWEFI